MANPITLTVDNESRLNLMQSLELLTLPSASKKRILKKAGQQVRKQARDNIRQQRTVNGSPMAARQSGRGKLLKKMGKNLTTVTDEKKVDVTWKNKLEGMVAYKHQHGVPEVYTAKKMEKIYGKSDYDQPASRKQAKALIAAGFKLYKGKMKNGKTKSKKPTIRWITENLNMGYAGYMVSVLRQQSRNRQWTVNTPARPFLGVTGEQATAIMADELKKERERRT